MPSVGTLELIARQTHKPMGFFLNDNAGDQATEKSSDQPTELFDSQP